MTPASDDGGDAGRVIEGLTVTDWPAGTAGTLIEPIVTSADPPGVDPDGVRTTRARVAGASAVPLLVICWVSVNVPPQSVSLGESGQARADERRRPGDGGADQGVVEARRRCRRCSACCSRRRRSGGRSPSRRRTPPTGSSPLSGRRRQGQRLVERRLAAGLEPGRRWSPRRAGRRRGADGRGRRGVDVDLERLGGRRRCPG